MHRTDFLILFKKLLVTIALYLIPVLFVWAILSVAGNFRQPSVSKSQPAADTIRIIDN